MSPGGLANPPPHTHTLSKRDTTRIGASDIWRPEEGGYFFFLQGQLSQGQLEFQNLSVANDSARQQLRSGSHRERERERDVPAVCVFIGFEIPVISRDIVIWRKCVN